jgi:hypothetical protein
MKLSKKSRRILKAIYRGVGVIAISLTFGTCGPIAYGMPSDDYPAQEGEFEKVEPEKNVTEN